MTRADLVIDGVIAHVIADWFLQNEWMALQKTKWWHPAGWIHAALHGALQALVFRPGIAAALALSHWIIDLRFILAGWRETIGQTTTGPFAIPVALWQDQAAHLIMIYLGACAAELWR